MLLRADARDVVREKGKFHLARVLLVTGGHLVEGVAHDGNQHVQDDNGSKRSRQHEQTPVES